MLQAIRDSGFTPVPEEIRLKVTGALEGREGRLVLLLDGMKDPRALTCVVAQHNETRDRMLARAAGNRVEIQGRWRIEGEGALEVETIEVTPP